MSDVACPMLPGIHGWIWPGGRSEGWKTARQQARRLLDLGFVGAIPQNGMNAAQWLEGKDPGESLHRFEVFQQQGLQVTCGFGADGASASAAVITQELIRAYSLPSVLAMLDEESDAKWEPTSGHNIAQQTVDDTLTADPNAYLESMFCPWWAPEYHARNPVVIFAKLFRHLFTQDYGALGSNAPMDHTLDYLEHSRAEYMRLYAITPQYIHLAFQLYSHSQANAGRIALCGETVMAAWDVEELDETMRRALLARMYLLARGFPATLAGLQSFQTSAGLASDGILGPATLGKMGIVP